MGAFHCTKRNIQTYHKGQFGGQTRVDNSNTIVHLFAVSVLSFEKVPIQFAWQ